MALVAFRRVTVHYDHGLVGGISLEFVDGILTAPCSGHEICNDRSASVTSAKDDEGVELFRNDATRSCSVTRRLAQLVGDSRSELLCLVQSSAHYVQ